MVCELSRRLRWLGRMSPCLAFGILAAPPGAAAQDVQCESTYLRLSETEDSIPRPLRYSPRTVSEGGQPRVHRCEGTFRPEVDDPALWVAGFHQSFESFNADSVPALRLTWTRPDSAETILRVQSVKRTQPYRMDSRGAVGETTFEWPTSVVRSLDLAAEDLAPLAYSVDPAARLPLVLPLVVSWPEATTRLGSYTLTVVPNTRLDDVLVSLARVASVGSRPTVSADYLRYQEPVGERIYLNRRAIRIRIETEPGAESGTYLIEVTGILSNGTPLPAQPVWFYHDAANSGTPDGR